MGTWRWDKKSTVEECKSISTTFLKKHGYLACSGTRHGGCRWTNGQGEKIGSIGFEVTTWDRDGSIRFRYTQTDRHSNEKESLDYTARLDTTSCFFGGRRWWFICPLVKTGVSCGRRVGKLYLVGKYFGCRHCHDLTYESAQEHDKRIDVLLKNPGLLRSTLENPNLGASLLALKAGLIMERRMEKRMRKWEK